jgi:hypothetical protein
MTIKISASSLIPFRVNSILLSSVYNVELKKINSDVVTNLPLFLNADYTPNYIVLSCDLRVLNEGNYTYKLKVDSIEVDHGIIYLKDADNSKQYLPQSIKTNEYI